MKKRGAVELSISTIIVLVFAITLLALGIPLIRNLIEKGQVEIIKSFNEAQQIITDKIENSGETLALGIVYDIEVKQGKTSRIFYGLRNTLDSGASFSIDGSGALAADGSWLVRESVAACYVANNPALDATKIELRTVPSSYVERGALNILELDIIVPSGMAKDEIFYCAMVIKEPIQDALYARKDFTVKVV